MNKGIYPPPSTIDLKTIPDYYLGCLIYHEDIEDNTMKWICYDGRTKYRCYSRSAAEKCAQQLHHLTTKEGVGHLMSAQHFLTRAWQTLDKAADESDIETRLWLQLKAVETRRLADAIDLLISQRIEHTDKI